MNILRGTLTIVVLILIWQTITSVFDLPPYILPSPILVLKSLKQYWGLIIEQSIPTIIESGLGFILSIIFGTFCALMLVYFRSLRLWFLPVLLISQTLPVFAIAPLFVVWLGYGMASKIAVTCAASHGELKAMASSPR